MLPLVLLCVAVFEAKIFKVHRNGLVDKPGTTHCRDEFALGHAALAVHIHNTVSTGNQFQELAAVDKPALIVHLEFIPAIQRAAEQAHLLTGKDAAVGYLCTYTYTVQLVKEKTQEDSRAKVKNKHIRSRNTQSSPIKCCVHSHTCNFQRDTINIISITMRGCYCFCFCFCFCCCCCWRLVAATCAR